MIWHYSKGTSPHYQGQVSNEGTGETIAVTYNDEDGKHVQLIAAAPDMLEALKDLAQYFAEWGKDYPDDAKRFNAAYAAIHKAEGN